MKLNLDEIEARVALSQALGAVPEREPNWTPEVHPETRFAFYAATQLPALIARVRELEAANRWRDVREELPPFVQDSENEDEASLEISDDVIIWVHGQPMSAYRSRFAGRNKWSWILNWVEASVPIEAVTHWQSPPAPPEEQSDARP